MRRVVVLPVVIALLLVMVPTAAAPVHAEKIENFVLDIVYPKDVVTAIYNDIAVLRDLAQKIRSALFADPVDNWFAKWIAVLVEEYADKIEDVVERGVLDSDTTLVRNAIDEVSTFYGLMTAKNVTEIEKAIEVLKDIEAKLEILATPKVVIIGRVVGFIDDGVVIYGSVYDLLPLWYGKVKVGLYYRYDGYVLVKDLPSDLKVGERLAIIGTEDGCVIVTEFGLTRMLIVHALGYNVLP